MWKPAGELSIYYDVSEILSAVRFVVKSKISEEEVEKLIETLEDYLADLADPIFSGQG